MPALLKKRTLAALDMADVAEDIGV